MKLLAFEVLASKLTLKLSAMTTDSDYVDNAAREGFHTTKTSDRAASPPWPILCTINKKPGNAGFLYLFLPNKNLYLRTGLCLSV